MSDVKVIQYLLSHNTALNNVVPAANIMGGKVTQGTPLPTIGIKHVSGTRRKTADGAAIKYCWGRVQITVNAEDYPQQKDVLKLVRAALPTTRGVVAGVNVDSVTHELDGPDFSDGDSGVYMESIDYVVAFNE